MAPAKQKKPLIAENAKDLATLKVLQKTDPSVVEILGSASHVTLYGFDLDQQAWSRKNVEGSLFVVRRNTAPTFQFVVLNRLSTENTVEDLLGAFEFELSPPYLLYRSSTEVNGIWFYKQEECDAMSALFDKITGAFGADAPAANGASTEAMLAAMGLGTQQQTAPPPPVAAPVAAAAPDPRKTASPRSSPPPPRGRRERRRRRTGAGGGARPAGEEGEEEGEAGAGAGAGAAGRPPPSPSRAAR